MPVALYLRVSTEEQRERQSIATQREFAERYCALHQFSISAVYADDGISGTVPLDSRPAGARVLPDARLHRFDQLLVFRLDRRWRGERSSRPSTLRVRDLDDARREEFRAEVRGHRSVRQPA